MLDDDEDVESIGTGELRSKEVKKIGRLFLLL